jgi:Tfp pilus assembly protein PilO
MIDLPRVYGEKRRLVIALAVAALVNVAFYAAVIYPRTSSAGALEARAQAAALQRMQAQADLNAAEATRTGQERAARQLAKFYDSVLPQGQKGARQITYLRLAALADESNLDYDRRSIQAKHERESVLEHMDMTMVLEGDYRDVRRFIHKIETAPEFVVIHDISLVQGEKNTPLSLTLQLSTYYKAGS